MGMPTNCGCCEKSLEFEETVVVVENDRHYCEDCYLLRFEEWIKARFAAQTRQAALEFEAHYALRCKGHCPHCKVSLMHSGIVMVEDVPYCTACSVEFNV